MTMNITRNMPQPQAFRNVQFAGQQPERKNVDYKPSFVAPEQPKFSGYFDSITKKEDWTPKRIAKWVGVGLLSVFGMHAGCHSYDTNPNGTRSVVVNHTGNGSSPNVRGEGLVITFPPYITTNVKYPINNQTVKETFQPLSRDGVRINGNGQNKNEGVDVRISFQIDPGEDGKYDSVFKIHTKILSSNPNPDYQKSDTTEFSADDQVTKALYFQEVLPRLKSDIYTLSTLYPAEDFHNSRDFLTTALNKGYKETVKEKDGTERHIDIKPLADQLAPLGIKVNFVNVAHISLPQFLKAELQKRAELPLATKNAELEEKTNVALADAAREKAKIQVAVNLQNAIGVNSANLAEAKGKVDIAKQKADENIAAAKGDAAAKIADKKGEAEALIARKKGEADGKVEEAKGISTAAVIEATGEAESIVKRGEATGKALLAEGKMLEKYPQLIDQMKIAANKDARVALAKRVGLILVDPGTSPDDIILRIGNEAYRPDPNAKKEEIPTPRPVETPNK